MFLCYLGTRTQFVMGSVHGILIQYKNKETHITSFDYIQSHQINHLF